MKKYIFKILLIVMMFNLCGCNALQSEQNDALGVVVDIQTQDQDSQEQIDQEQTPQNQEAVLYDGEHPVVEYEESELFKMAITNDTSFNLNPFPKDYEMFCNRLKRVDCSIIAGRAFGTRTANPRVLTPFSVEKVYAGPDVPDEITIGESFGVYTNKEDNEPYILSLGYESLPLVNDQPTLLFVYPHPEEKDIYLTTVLAIPLPEDYQNYDEEYLTELLDYFRGDRSAYKYPELTIKDVVIEGRPIPTEYGGVYWPMQEISDEALLEQMNDHILLRLVTDYKIKIWPFDHAQYPEERNFSDYFLEMSYPPTVKP